jgi:hypothetical protein
VAVPRIGRILDIVAAAFVIAGAALYGNAYIGLEALRAKPVAVYSSGMSIDMLAEFHSLERLSLIGLAIAVGGIGVALTAAFVARRAKA